MLKEPGFIITANKTKITALSNASDGYLLEWSDAGLILHVILSNPLPEEKKVICNTDHGLELAFTDINDHGFLCVRFDKFSWGECPFEPCLYNSFEIKDYDGLTECIPLNILLIDSQEGGLVKGIRLVSIGPEFSKLFAEWCKNHRSKNKYNEMNYDQEICCIQ